MAVKMVPFVCAIFTTATIFLSFLSPFLPGVNGQTTSNVRCYSCLKTTNCYEGECNGIGCFKIQGRRNEETVTYKGCLFQIPGITYRDECKQGEQGGIQGNMCTCLGERCNSAESLTQGRYHFLWTIICALSVLTLLRVFQR